MHWPKISVFCLTFNQEDFVRESMDSILAQDYPNLEIVVADDASEDGTRAILLEYARRFPGKFRLILASENVGIPANSNRALQACDGEFVAWTAGDDLMVPGKLSAQADLMMRSKDVALCYHDLEIFDSESGKVIGHFNTGPRSIRPREGGPETLVQYGTFLGGCSVFGRRSACPEAGYDTRIRHASDWLMWIEMSLAGGVRFLPEVLGKYRRHERNVTRRPHPDFSDQFLTLDIVDAKYPQLARFSRRHRGLLFGYLGMNEIRRGRPMSGAWLIAKGLRIGGIHAGLMGLGRAYKAHLEPMIRGN